MIIVLSIIVITASLLSAFVFGGSFALSIAAAIAAAVIALFDIIFARRKKIFRIVSAVLSAVLLCFCIYIPSVTAPYGYYDYSELSADYLQALMKEDDHDIEELSAEITERYGTNDEIRYTEAIVALASGDMDKANLIISSFDDPQSIQYYLVKEEYLKLYYEDPEDVKFSLRGLYNEAVQTNPGWAYAQSKLGAILVEDGEFVKAAFHLTNAVAYAETVDPETYYFLGVALIEQGDSENGTYYFNQAIDAGADDDLKKSMVWYANKAGIEVGK